MPWILALVLPLVAVADEPALDVLVRRDGSKLEGILLAEEPGQVRFLVVLRRKHKRTLTMKTSIPLAEIARIERLDPAVRAKRLAELQQISWERAGEARAVKKIELVSAPWLDGKGSGLRFVSRRFDLLSQGDAGFTREAAYKLEQIFAAYERWFRVTRNPAGKVRIYLFGTSAAYQAALGHQIKNPAVYIPARNLVLAGTDLAAMRAKLAAARKNVVALKQRIESERKLLARFQSQVARQKEAYRKQANDAVSGGKSTPQQARDFWRRVEKWEEEQRRRIHQRRQELAKLERELTQLNDRNHHIVGQYSGNLIKMLYHEAFHAFLYNFLFTPQTLPRVPLWIHEGMAQFFENSFIEGRELRIGTLDAARRRLLQRLMREGKTVRLRDLLVAGSDKFLVRDALDLEQSTAHYLQSWAVVYHLASGAEGRGGNLFRRYVERLAGGTDPVEAFPAICGKSADEVDAAWRKRFSGR